MRRNVHTIRLSPGRAGVGPVVTAIVHTADAAGPTVAVTANVHGDETTGVVAALQLDSLLPADLLRGRVVLYPSLNPVGLQAISRVFPADGTDLNRVFPGDGGGSVAERAAAAIWVDIQKQMPDALIDLHADSANAIPYAIVDRAVGLSGAERARMTRRVEDIAAATGITVLQEYPDSQYRRFGLDHSLAGAMVNHGRIPAVTVESGPRRAAPADAVEVSVQAVRGVLAHLGMIRADVHAHPSRREGSRWRRSSTRRTAHAGVFRAALAPGACFEAEAVVGSICALDGTVLEEVRAQRAGIVVSWMDTAWVEAHAVAGMLGLVEDGAL